MFAFSPLTRGLFKRLFCTPSSLVSRVLSSVLHVLEDIFALHSIVDSGVQRIAGDLPRSHPFVTILSTSAVCCLICGTLNGCGGGLLRSMFGLDKRQWHFQAPRQLSAPQSAPPLVNAFVASCVFFFTSNPISLLPFTLLSYAHAKLLALLWIMLHSSLSAGSERTRWPRAAAAAAIASAAAPNTANTDASKAAAAASAHEVKSPESSSSVTASSNGVPSRRDSGDEQKSESGGERRAHNGHSSSAGQKTQPVQLTKRAKSSST
jgi:hypothetical protein